jgi:hypothetical protein
LEVYSDADWAGTKEDRSISEVLATINGETILLNSKKQNLVVTLSTKVEYMALSTGVKEVIWIQWMFKELGQTPNDGNVINIDNQGAIALAKNPEHHVGPSIPTLSTTSFRSV